MNENQKVLFLIIDGAADEGPNTPLMTARMPNLELLARNSMCGLWEGPKAPPGYNVRSLSELGTLQLLGYGANETPGRGYLEALGIGIKPDKRAIYVRANFATVGKDMRIIDRRAGRDERGLDELAKTLAMEIDGVKIKLYHSHGHRGVLMLKPTKGALSTDVSDSDIGLDKPQPIKATKFYDAARKTANVLNTFLAKAHDILSAASVNSMRKLPVNYLLLRGAGQYRETERFLKRWHMKACCIAASGIVKGVARYVGMKVVEVKGATGKTDTDLKSKLTEAVNALNIFDFVLLHIKGTDTASHDKMPTQKRAFLERIDREVVSELLHMRNINIVVATDHVTSSKSGEHIFGPVPFVLYQPYGHPTNVGRFDESHCLTGLILCNPMERLLLELQHRHTRR